MHLHEPDVCLYPVQPIGQFPGATYLLPLAGEDRGGFGTVGCELVDELLMHRYVCPGFISDP